MSIIGLYCKDCENDGQMLENGTTPGFNMDVPSAIMFATVSYEKNSGKILGNEALGNMLQEMMSQVKRDGIICANPDCKSSEIDVRIGPDLVLEREEEISIDFIDPEEIVNDIQLSQTLDLPGLKRVDAGQNINPEIPSIDTSIFDNVGGK